MKSGLITVPLSHLAPSRRNPRKVKPSRQSHQCLVALIRAYGLLQPLVVRAMERKPKHYEVVAGHRRLSALREIHRSDGDPRIPCVLHDVDAVTADAVSLGENFGREAMHPLDEAEAFAKLAAEQAKGVEAIAAAFSCTERFVRQRMKLASLAEVVKAAYRSGQIGTATAEAFASVPEDRQLQVWKEMNGHGGKPLHAEHVRNVIAHEWIDATHALFDLSTLPEPVVSRDLFSERVLVERQAFMTAQIEALAAERAKLIDDGWHEVVAGRYEEIHDRSLAMDPPEREFEEQTSGKLAKLEERREKVDAKFQKTPDEDEKALNTIAEKLEALEAEQRQIEREAPVFFSEATKAIATVFLILCPDGEVRREYRVPRRRPHQSAGGNGHGIDGSVDGGPPAPPTSDDLGDKQLAVTFTHEALMVREALLKNAPARKRVLALILHEKVRSEAVAMRHEPNCTTLQATGDGFVSPALDRLRDKRTKLDPFPDRGPVEDWQGYQRLAELSGQKLDALIDLLVVERITAHLQRRTDLVHNLADELKVNVRGDWRPHAAWLSGFQKIQLSHLITLLMGSAHAPAPERKKTELVEVLAKLFADAAQGKLQDKQLAEKVNRWLPSNLTKMNEETARQQESK